MKNIWAGTIIELKDAVIKLELVMASTIDTLFKGYSIKEIEEILLKSALEDLRKRNSPPLIRNSKTQHILRPALKM